VVIKQSGMAGIASRTSCCFQLPLEVASAHQSFKKYWGPVKIGSGKPSNPPFKTVGIFDKLRFPQGTSTIYHPITDLNSSG